MRGRQRHFAGGGLKMSRKLQDLRREIDALDRRIVRLLNRRATVAVRIGREKRRAGLRVQDPVREREVLRRVQRVNRGPLRGRALADVYRRIIALCVDLE